MTKYLCPIHGKFSLETGDPPDSVTSCPVELNAEERKLVLEVAWIAATPERIEASAGMRCGRRSERA